MGGGGGESRIGPLRLLREHLEAGQVDLVHQIILGMGLKNEPAMPLEEGDRSQIGLLKAKTSHEQPPKHLE